MTTIRAEIISVGDEITCGAQLDTNSQWISQQLRATGIDVAFHSAVGDDLADIVEVFRIASQRVELIIATGGLGPTADDLTRQGIARMAQVELREVPAVLEKIVQMYRRRGREMPPSNKIQAFFPEGSMVIENPEGTAPGIDYRAQSADGKAYRILALPGVPAEMKQMWQRTIAPSIRCSMDTDLEYHQHTIRCFGAGESYVESLLPDLVQRGRDPQVGITASSATISLRLSTRGRSRQHCLEKMQPTVTMIKSLLGDLVFGENDEELQGVVFGLLQSRGETISIVDAGLDGDVAELITHGETNQTVLRASEVVEPELFPDCQEAARNVMLINRSSLGLAIGPVDREYRLVDEGNSYFEAAIADATSGCLKPIQFIGHSSYRDIKAAKEVLNFLRLYLMKPASSE